jgi:hypothetical protein
MISQAGTANQEGSETMTYYHGTRSSELTFRPAICFTSYESNAAAYGDNVFAVEIDRSKLNVCKIEMTDEELREAIDDQEWPCDRASDVERYIADGYDAVEYLDVDQYGDTHDCIRILTQRGWEAVSVQATA